MMQVGNCSEFVNDCDCTEYESSFKEQRDEGEKVMSKINKKIMSLFLSITMITTLIFSGITSVYAEENYNIESTYKTNVVTTEEDYQNLKDVLSSVEQYIDFEDSKLFDEEKARHNNESEEVIQIGLAYNEMYKAEKQGDYEKVNRRKRAVISGLTHYGNWCGKGNNGKSPIDILDAQCKTHDKCYSKKGMWNSSCDVDFVYNIARNFGAINKIGWHARTYAVAAIMVFAGKVGGTSALKTKFPILAPFLP